MDNWELIANNDLNRMLKIRDDLHLINKEEYPYLIILSHKYATSDDLLFPEPSTLAFFAAFEERCLYTLESGIYVAQDINTGILEIHIYTFNYKKTIIEAVEYLKQESQYHIEFKVIADNSWDRLKKLRG